MVVVLEAVAGPVTGRRIEVKAGTILRVGRTARSDYALPEDGYLSSVHFAVEFDGTQCRIRDLGSSNGTFVNGNRVEELVVQSGDSLDVGGSTFRVHIDATGAPPSAFVGGAATQTARTPVAVPIQAPPALATTRAIATPTAGQPPSANWPGYSRAQGNLLDALFQPGLPVFAVLDAAKDSRIPAFLEAAGEPYYALDPQQRLPVFIVPLSAQSALLGVLVKDGWGHGWCSFFSGDTSLQAGCTHLPSFVTLYTAQGLPMAFRFWDTRILRLLLPQMSAEEATAFFGPFSRIIVEGDKPGSAVEFGLSARGARQQALNL